MYAIALLMDWRSNIKFGFILLALIPGWSCVQDTDLNQLEDVAQPLVLETNLMNSSLQAINFFDISTQREVSVVTDTLSLDMINLGVFEDQLSKTTLTFNLKNTIEKDFVVDFEFLNDLNEVQYKLQIQVNHGSVSSPFSVETTAIIHQPEITLFKEATHLVYKISLPLSDSSITAHSSGTIVLQSKANMFFQ